MKQTGMLIVSLRGVNFFGKFGLARVSREKPEYFKPLSPSLGLHKKQLVFLFL